MDNILQFRINQSQKLNTRLHNIKEATIAKHGKYDIKSDDILPLQSETDIMLLNKLIDTKDFVIIPVYDGNDIIQVYTLGLWYYWGLPELFFIFNEPVKNNNTFIDIFVNIIKTQLYKQYNNNIVVSNKSINRNIFDISPNEIFLNISEYDMKYTLKKMVDMDYLNKNISYMFWFYMYYMDIKTDNNKEPILYPLYKIDIDNYSYIENHINTITRNNITDKLVEYCKDESDISSIESISD
jgi:hypothetical protein